MGPVVVDGKGSRPARSVRVALPKMVRRASREESVTTRAPLRT
jgi:hypothetical protein